MEINNSNDLKELFQFIETIDFKDINSIFLKYRGKSLGFDLNFAMTQVEARNKTKRKLASFFKLSLDFLFPSSIAAQQATHQCVASFHALLIGKDISVADLTAGLGIDALTFALNGNQVTAVELDKTRFNCLEYNISNLTKQIIDNGGSIVAVNNNCLDWLRKLNKPTDCIYIDPARRDDANNRIFKFSDCKPDIISNYNLLLNCSETLIVKGSPLLDIKQTLTDLPLTSKIILTCLNGECKEVLVISKNRDTLESQGKVDIYAVDLYDRLDGVAEFKSIWKCTSQDIGKNDPSIIPGDKLTNMYLYDPNVALHKLRVGKKICEDFKGMSQIGPHTDFFISESYYPNFPGRVFQIKDTIQKKDLKNLKGQNIEVITRNYPLKADEIRKKYLLKSGDNDFIIGFRAGEKNIPTLVLCKKMSPESQTVSNADIQRLLS